MIDWTVGLQGLILGLGTVFIVLFSLIIFIKIMGSIIQKFDKKQPEKQDEKPIVKVISAENNEDEIIAAITAAIACMAQNEGKKFKIRSFKRI